MHYGLLLALVGAMLLQHLPWYNTPHVKAREMELCEARVAMLNSIYCRPRQLDAPLRQDQTASLSLSGSHG